MTVTEELAELNHRITSLADRMGVELEPEEPPVETAQTRLEDKIRNRQLKILSTPARRNEWTHQYCQASRAMGMLECFADQPTAVTHHVQRAMHELDKACELAIEEEMRELE